MIVLVNFNTYLGGGETLFVRMAEYLSKMGEQLKLFFPEKSYIANDLTRIGISEEKLCPCPLPTDYYYLTESEKYELRQFFVNRIKDHKNVKLVSFCYRDLYTLVDVAKNLDDVTISHLILHDEDNLYLCQSLFNKLEYKILKKKKFSNTAMLDFNNQLFYRLNKAGALIGEKETTKLVMRKYGIELDESAIVPPPMCEFEPEPPFVEKGKKIIWIGRFVDFKLPAIASMLNFISSHKDYSLSLVGDGDMEFINNFAQENKLDLGNVTFMGAQPYDKIGSIIKEHSIGYACGTSIVEIGKYGLPVITALFSPDHKLFSRSICGGLYNNRYRGNEGNNLLVGERESEQPLIEDVVKSIEEDFDRARYNSYSCMKADFNLSTNMEGYMRIIKNAKPFDYTSIKIPCCGIFRKLSYLLFK